MRPITSCVQLILAMTDMSSVHISSLDLNLLIALDALLTERNVTRAAARIGITQSAMSHSLKRLREMIGDPLLVRSKGEMVPTTRAEALALPMRRAFREIESALAAPTPFDPKTATNRLTIATSDYAELIMLPRLVERLTREAPSIDVRVRPVELDMSNDDLRNGTVDLAIIPTFPPIAEAGIFSRRLFDDELVCVMRKRHPLAKKKLTLARYVAASHALIAPRATEGGLIDDALARIKRKRRVAVMVPHFLIAPHLVATSDLLLTMAARVARVLEKPLNLVLKPVPFEVHTTPSFTMACVWHERMQNDPAHRWFRELLFDIAKTA
jgi:DNA-binding transcriptional LysR family regulator